MIWLQVVGYEGLYEVSEFGAVRNAVTKNIRSQYINNSGYYHLTLSKDGKSKTLLTHHLVAYAFHGERPEGYEICHADNDRLNACADNLRFDTKEANTLDRVKNYTKPYDKAQYARHVQIWEDLMGQSIPADDQLRLKQSL